MVNNKGFNYIVVFLLSFCFSKEGYCQNYKVDKNFLFVMELPAEGYEMVKDSSKDGYYVEIFSRKSTRSTLYFVDIFEPKHLIVAEKKDNILNGFSYHYSEGKLTAILLYDNDSLRHELSLKKGVLVSDIKFKETDETMVRDGGTVVYKKGKVINHAYFTNDTLQNFFAAPARLHRVVSSATE